MTSFDFSLIIVNYNGFEITKNLLNSIFLNSSDQNTEIIVVDNASTDDSLAKLKNLFSGKPNFHVIEKSENDFLTAAYNKGFEAARGRVAVFMNNDLIVTKNWLEELKKAFEDKTTGLAGVSLLSEQNKEIIDNLGCRLNFLSYGSRIDTGRRFDPQSAQLNLQKTFFVPGSVLAIRSDLFRELNGFDEDYSGNYEDVDLAWRAKLLGYQTVVAKKSIVYHLGSWTVKKHLGKTNSAYLCRKNRLVTILKNSGLGYLVLILPIYFSLQALIFLKELLFDRSLTQALTTPRALWWNLRYLKLILLKRSVVRQKKKVSDWSIVKEMVFF